MQPRAEDGLEVEVGDDQVLLEHPPAREALTVLVHDHAGAVEHELVLATHHVDVGHAHEIVHCAGRHQLIAEAGLAGMVGRAVDVDEELGAAEGLHRGRSRGVPDVLAHVHGEGRLARREDLGLGARLEVAVLVEDAVVRQILLVIDPGSDSVVQHGRRVEDVVALVDEAHHDREPPRDACHLVERLQIRLDEGGLEQEILGRIAGDRELGEGHQLGAERARPLDRVHDHADVAVEVADRGVDLPQGDTEPSHGPYCTGPRGHLL